MKNIILTTLLIGIMGLATAQNRKNILIDSLRIERAAGIVKVSFQVTGDKKAIKPNNKLTLTPTLYNGDKLHNFKSVVIESRRSKILDFRNRVTSQGVTTIDNGRKLNYTASIPFQPWMEGSSLRIDQVMSGCCTENIFPAIVMAQNLSLMPKQIPVYVVKPHLSYIIPEVEAIKKRSESGTAYLEFMAARSVLMSNFMSNDAELAKIRKSIDLIRNDNNVVFRNISLRGTCSPEGSWASNTTLAQQRTKSVQKYIESKYGYASNVFIISSQPEDWQGLATLVEQDATLSQRDAILDIINSDVNPDKKDQQIVSLDNGSPYRYMLANLYPKLRRVDYSINYDVKGFDLQESQEVLRTRPQNLSLNELYLIAQRYPEGSKEFGNLFVLAARLFPNDATANINAATIALANGNVSDAAMYLNRVKDNTTAAYQNTKGVLMMLRENYPAAKTLFESAAAQGLDEASENLLELDKKMDNITKIKLNNLL